MAVQGHQVEVRGGVSLDGQLLVLQADGAPWDVHGLVVEHPDEDEGGHRHRARMTQWVRQHHRLVDGRCVTPQWAGVPVRRVRGAPRVASHFLDWRAVPVRVLHQGAAELDVLVRAVRCGDDLSLPLGRAAGMALLDDVLGVQVRLEVPIWGLGLEGTATNVPVVTARPGSPLRRCQAVHAKRHPEPLRTRAGGVQSIWRVPAI